MRVLYLTAELPYPLTSGVLRHYYFLRELGRRHEITLVSLTARDQVSPETISALAPVTRQVHVFGAGRNNTRGEMTKQLLGPSIPRLLRRRRAMAEMSMAVRRLLRAQHFHLLFLSGKNTYAALDGLDDIPIVADCCDAAHVRLREELKDAPSLRRLWGTLQYRRVKSIEQSITQRTPHVVFASERDRVCLLPDGGVVIPQGVDFEFWCRQAPPARHNRLLFTGVMNYPPNHDAALRLCRTIFPQVQHQVAGSELVIAGRDPLPELVDAARRQSNVTVTGIVPDLRPFLDQAAVFVAPIRYASGMQNKVLEAMAMQVPVVTTTAVAEGLQVGSDFAPVITADDDASFAQAVIALLADKEERSRLAREGCAFVRRHFVWSRNAEKLERLWMKAAGLEGICEVPIYAETGRRA